MPKVSMTALLTSVVKRNWPKGTRVELIFHSDLYSGLKPGDQGTVSMVDSLGTVHVNWDNGSTLGLVLGEDHWRMVPPSTTFFVIRFGEEDGVAVEVTDAFVNILKGEDKDAQITIHLDHGEARELAETILEEIGSERNFRSV